MLRQTRVLTIAAVLGMLLLLNNKIENRLVASPEGECDPSYPDVYASPHYPNLNCDDVPYGNIKVEGDDPHGFDREGDGVGCES
jgi:hypothetical protein